MDREKTQHFAGQSAGFGDILLTHSRPAHSAEGLPAHVAASHARRVLCFRLRQGYGAAGEQATPKQNAQHISQHAGRFVLATSYSRAACRRTTIGAAAFHCRVRNGNGWCHCATVTRVRSRTGGSLLSQRRKREAASLETTSFLQRTADSLISTYRSLFWLRTADATT